MTTVHHCYCGAVAEIGYPTEEGLRWLCNAHAPWQCASCGPEASYRSSVEDWDEVDYPRGKPGTLSKAQRRRSVTLGQHDNCGQLAERAQAQCGGDRS